ncbi:hypothetical protein AX16_004041 [Volvariella volvacea WC 439]|nr:hypothetical protein AX16_004041 [Volvariella volvacea WC 439]
MATATEAIARHILDHGLSRFTERPLFVAIQGPQGSGKSYTTAKLRDLLSAPPHNLNVATLSIDDLYLDYDGLHALATENSDNVLLQGRGLPGTHDVGLALQLLNNIRTGTLSERIELPRFDKSLHDGQGDRLPMDGTGPVVTPPVDIVIVEGWCMGFRAATQDDIEQTWIGKWQQEQLKLGLDYGDKPLKKEHIYAVNERLRTYNEIWNFFHVFVQIKPATSLDVVSPYTLIYSWRLQQEHNMKILNGGRGMSDDAVKRYTNSEFY